MGDYSLVPVDHQPNFENVSLVPVDHDPFIAEGETQGAQSQQTQPQPQPPATGIGQPSLAAPANTRSSEEGESWNPDTGNSDTAGANRAPAPTPAPDQPAYDWSRFHQPFGELNPATFTPTQQIGHLAADGLAALGVQPNKANDLARRIGGLLGLTPLGFLGSALDLIDAKRRDDLPGAVAAAFGMIPGARGGLARAAGEEAGAGLRALTKAAPRTPASRAAEKGICRHGYDAEWRADPCRDRPSLSGRTGAAERCENKAHRQPKG